MSAHIKNRNRQWIVWAVFVFVLCLFQNSRLFAQDKPIEFTTTVDKAKVAKGQRFKVHFNINKEGGDGFTPPDFKNFEVVAGPMTYLSSERINGVSTFSQEFVYTIAPKKKGYLTISPAKINIRGKVYKSNPVRITVVSASELPKNPNDPYYIATQSTFLDINLSKTNPYVGEGITMECYLYFKYGINNYEIKKYPKYTGFLKQDIDLKKINVVEIDYRGERYNKALLFKTILTPQQAGRLLIDPFVMNIKAGVPTGQADFFGNAITRNVDLKIESKVRYVLTQQLPSAGKPTNFQGAIGDFKLDLNASKSKVLVNESLMVKLSISGKGNLNQLALPKIVSPSALELYAPERKENIQLNLGAFKGSKGTITDNYTLVPQKAGNYKIPAVSFAYFNPKEGKYHQLTTEDIWIDVIDDGSTPILGNQNTNPGGTTSDLNVAKTRINPKNAMRYLQQHTSFQPLKQDLFFNSRLFYGIMLGILSIIPLTMLFGRYKKERDSDSLVNRKRKADKMARKYLQSAKKKINERHEFYEALECALYNYLKAKLAMDATEINKNNIQQTFDNKKVDATLAQAFIEILSACEMARYTPADQVIITKDYKKTIKIITQLDRYL